VNKLAEAAMASYKDEEGGEETPAKEGDYSADLESEMGALSRALKAGDLKAAARAFKEATKLC
jgi:hypothetical protein